MQQGGLHWALDELLVSSGPSGRAACWEPSERVHERRIELCGDGASWRPVGPVHFFNLTGPLLFFSPARRHMAVIHIHIHSPTSSPHQTGELGLSAWMATSPPPFVSKWFNISFVLNHIRRPRPTPLWVSEVTLFPPSELFDIMQDGRCNYNKDLWQCLSRPPTDACRSAWWHHHSFIYKTSL